MRTWILMLLLVAAVIGDARPSLAAPQLGGCLEQFMRCQYRAATSGNFWWRTMQALDCEIGLVSCLRHAFL